MSPRPRNDGLPSPMRDLNWHPGEAYLYRIGEGYFVVYTGASKDGWDACPSSLSAETSKTIVSSAMSREDAVAQLVANYG